MLTLTKASIDTKIALKWTAIAIAVLLVLFLLFKAAVYVKNVLFPTPPPKPTVAFGKVFVPGFPQNVISTKFTYTINTLSGQLPAFNNQIKVYRMLSYYPDLLAVTKAQEKVNSIGFTSTPIELSNRLYEWQSNANNSGISKNIVVDTINYNFSINSSFTTASSILSGQNLPNLTGSSDLALNTLSNLNLIPDDLDNLKTKTQTFLINANQQLVQTSSLSQAQIIQVNFFQKDIDNLPIVYDDPSTSSMTFLVAGGISGGQIVSAKFVHQEISGLSSTYPIKTSEQAFNELKKGNAYIAAYTGNSSNINIRNVYLAYYISSNLQYYLNPIIVFQGDDGFYAYVDAISDEWISN